MRPLLRQHEGPVHRRPFLRALLLPLFTLLCLTARPGRGEIIERVVAVVGKDVILLSEVNTRVRPYLKQILSIKDPAGRERALRRVQRRELQRLIDERLILQEAVRRKIQVSEGEVNRAIQSVLRQNKITYKELVQALKSQGQSMEQYRTILRRQILRLKVINFAVRARITVSEDEARAFYEAQKRKLGVQKKVKVAVIRLPMSPGKAAQAMANAKQLAARLAKHPEAFAAEARRLSNHPSASKGGDLGFIDRGVLPPMVERRVFAKDLKLPALVGPVRTDEGIYIVRVLSRRESEALPFSQVKNKVRQQLLMQRMQTRTAKWLRELRKKTYIDIRL